MKKKLIIVGGVFLVLLLICLVIRHNNLAKKAKLEEENATTEEQNYLTDVDGNIIYDEEGNPMYVTGDYALDEEGHLVYGEDGKPMLSADTETTTEESSTSSQYTQEVDHIENDKKDGRVEVTTEEVTEATTEEVKPYSEYYETGVKIFDHTDVPAYNMDGSTCSGYYNAVSLSDFGSMWGTSITDKDKYTSKRYLVGVSQNPDDTEKGDLQSTGWLIDHLDGMEKDTAIKFTNLHTIGSLSTSHVALLCSYDWYSAFGLTDTLVLFEDVSGTLNNSDFKAGDIFSCTVWVHNIKVVTVNGKRVVCIEYAM